MTMAPIAMSVDLQEELQKQLNIDEVFGFDVKRRSYRVRRKHSCVVDYHWCYDDCCDFSYEKS